MFSCRCLVCNTEIFLLHSIFSLVTQSFFLVLLFHAIVCQLPPCAVMVLGVPPLGWKKPKLLGCWAGPVEFSLLHKPRSLHCIIRWLHCCKQGQYNHRCNVQFIATCKIKQFLRNVSVTLISSSLFTSRWNNSYWFAYNNQKNYLPLISTIASWN